MSSSRSRRPCCGGPTTAPTSARPEAVTAAQALLLYTGRAAPDRAARRRGQIETGYEGSFVVLDRDIFTIDPQEIDQVQVAQTWIRGERVYARR